MGRRIMQTTLKVRDAEQKDKIGLKNIVDLSFPRLFRFFALPSLNSENGKTLVGERGGKVAGFAKLTDFSVGELKCGCILWIAVHPSHRREGIASTLVQTSVADLKRRGVEMVFASVQRRNNASIATFGKSGFERGGLMSLWQTFGWHLLEFYRDIWYAPGELVLMYA
jgi:[ribosomal protein S18]-alanine N-acetyltransferase